MRASELLLIVRAQNQASGALRSVARDMRAIGAMQQSAFRAKGMAAATGDVEAYSKALNRIRWERVSAGGRILQHTARVAEYAGLVLGGSLAVMANNAAKFDTSVTLAATQTRKIGQSFVATSKNSQILQADIRKLMTEFPASAEDFSKAAYDIYSSTDVNFKKGRKALKLFAQAAVAGQTDVQTATDAGIVVLNNFGNNVDRLPARLQRMFSAVRFGRMTFKDFATSMSTIGPAARAANQSFDEMAGTFAFLTRHLDIGKARVGFARVLDVLASPKMLSGLKDVGVQVQDTTHHLLPLHQILGNILERFPKLRQGGTDAMNFFKNISGNTGTIQARRAFTFLVQFFDKAGKDGASYLEMLRKVKNDNNEFTTSLQAMEKTTGVRWGVFVNQLKALALEIGADLVPALLKLSGPIEDVVNWWRKLDAGTRATVARFAAYSAAFLLVGGAVTFLLGTFMRLFATLGRFSGLSGAMLGTLIAITGAVAVLTGNFRTLSDILGMITDFAFSSWQNFAITLAGITLAVVKLTNALKGLVVAQGIGGAAGSGGILAGLMGGARNARAGGSLVAEATRMKGILGGVAATAMLMPPSFIAVGAAIAAAAGGLFLWHKHMQAVKSDAEDIKRSFDLGAASRLKGDVFQGLVGSTEDVTRAQVNVRNIQRSMRELRNELKGTRGDRRAQILDDLKIQSLDLVHAQNQVTEAIQKNNRQFRALAESFAALQPAQRSITTLRDRLRELQHIQKITPLTPGIGGAIDHVKDKLKALMDQTRASASGLPRIFNQAITGLAKLGEIRMPSANALKDLFNIATQKGRMLRIPEIKAIIRAELNPGDIKRLPAQLQRQFRTAVKVRVQVEGAQKAGELAGQLAGGGKQVKVTAKAETSKAKAAFQALRAPITKTVNLKTSQDPQTFGAQISAGIEAGLYPIHQQVIQDVIKNPITKAIQSKSPSIWAAEKVGKPIVQGIALGILESQGLIEKAATASITFFESAAIQKAQEAKKKITDALLIGDVSLQAKTLTQFNNAIARLGRRKVPKELIDQLAALGPDQAKFISQIASMSAKELAKYVAAWRKANAQVKRSMRATQEDIKNATKQMHDDLLSKLNDMYSSLREQTASQFGDIFSNIDPATYGEGLKQAREDYANQMADFRGQISDLNNQIADTQKEGQQRLIDAINSRREELQSAMGALFSGDWMQGPQVQAKLDWGAKLGFDDLQKDLESQVNKFKRWRDDLTSLAAKVPPELAKQLEDLGPDAVDKLDILNNATDDQLRQYVTTWQDGQNAISQVANKTTVDTSDITARISDIVKQIDDVSQKMAALQYPKELTGDDLINALKDQMNQWNEYQGLLQSLIDKGLPAGFIEQLEQMGPDALPYLKALNSLSADKLDELKKTWNEREGLITEDTIKHLNRQLQLWYQYGVNIGANIVAGITSQQNQLQAYFEDLIMAFLKKRGFPTVGVDFAIGNTSSSSAPPYPVTGDRSSSGSGGSSGFDGGLGRFEGVRTGGPTINLNEGAVQVIAHQDETLDSTLSRAAFRLLTQVPG